MFISIRAAVSNLQKDIANPKQTVHQQCLSYSAAADKCKEARRKTTTTRYSVGLF